MLNSEWEIFWGAASTYKDVLGSEGLSVYRALAENEWSKVKQLAPGQHDDTKFVTRFRITHIMEELARETSDIEQLVAVKSRDLSIAYHFLGWESEPRDTVGGTRHARLSETDKLAAARVPGQGIPPAEAPR